MNRSLPNLANRLKRMALGIHHRLLPPDHHADWTPYLWLVWTGFYFLSLVPPTTAATRAATLLALAAFFPLYFRYYWAHGWERHSIIILIAALGIALTPFNLAGGGLLIYAGAFAGFSLRPRKALAAVGGLAIIAIIEYVALGFSPLEWIWAPTITIVAGLANVWAAERMRQNRELRRSQDEVRRLAAIAERERIARDLHDLLGHTLTLITVKAELAGTLAARDLPRAAAEIRELESIARDALAQVRQAVGGYRGDLAGEIANAGAALRAAGVEFKADTAAAGCESDKDAALAMIVREAVTNILRHAGAHECRLSLKRRADSVILEITDDGSAQHRDEGNGIRGMRERLQAIGGTLTLDFGAHGTRLRATIPGREPERETAMRELSA
ncbi:MAG TPA: sensor histidine kinase [Gammaproteobacteria bacterium]|nr:sensor histidine kinase [Gammaproteobacteria bacterium]